MTSHRAIASLIALASLSAAHAADDVALVAGRAASADAFACALYAQLAKQPGDLFFSPCSIDAAISMTMGGAEGETLDEMRRCLHLAVPDDRLAAADAALRAALAAKPVVDWNERGERIEVAPFSLTIANRLWGQRGYAWRDAFLARCADGYGAALGQLDFARAEPQSRAAINAWVAEQTHDRIRDLIAQPLDPDTRLALTDAVWFTSSWRQGEDFPKDRTANAPFHASAGDVEVPLMRRACHRAYLAEDGMRLTALPYRGDQLELIVVLPDAADGLAAVEAGLTAERLAGWRSRAQPALVDLSLPRFRVQGALELTPALEAMGMRRAFAATRAQFGRMADTAEPLSISAVVHRAWLSVDEDGTEAAAATAATFSVTSAPRPEQPVTMRCDHPFLFAIRHVATGTILFMGRLSQPASG